MPAKVCKYTEIPSEDQWVPEGESRSFYFNIKNCGSEEGNFYYGIEKDGAACVSKYNLFLKPGEIGYQLTCTVTNITKDVKIRYFAGIAEGGRWVEKYSHTITVHLFKKKPKAKFIDKGTACGISDGVNYVHPGGTLAVVAGTTLYAHGRIKNVGDSEGKLNLWVKNITDSKYECSSSAKRTGVDSWQDHSCSFIMPNKDIVIQLLACHYEDSVPIIDDYVSNITLKRKEAPKPKFEFIDSHCYVSDGKNICYKDKTIKVLEGARISVNARIKNVGNATGTPKLYVYDGSTKLCEKEGYSTGPGEYNDVSLFCCNMPKHDLNIVMKVYYGSRLDDTVGCKVTKRRNNR